MSIESQYIYVQKHNGKGMFSITTEVIICLKHHPTARVIIAGGICDYTFCRNKFEKFKLIF